MEMKQVKRDWTISCKQAKIDIEKEIEDIDIFDHNTARILLDCFRPGHLVLEAGCGTGKFCFWLRRRGINSIGIDIVPEIVEPATRYAKAKGLQALFIVGDVCKLPLRDNSLNGYISLGVIEHFRSITDVFQSLKECRRILKPGGKAIITIPNIFVPLRNRILLSISKGRIGFFHEFYTVEDVYCLGQIIGSNFKVEVFDMWLPFYNVIDGILRRLRLNEGLLRKIRFAFTKLPQRFLLLKYFLGYIYLVAEKPGLRSRNF